MKRKKNKKACHFTTPYHPYIKSRIQTVAVEIVGLEDNRYHLIVPVEINGIQGDMIIDTGASVTVVDRQVFPEDLPEEADVQMTSGSVTGQIHDVHLVKAAKFKIGKRTIKEMPLAAIDLKYVNEMYDKHLNRKIIGLLGCDFCVRYQVAIDYRKKEFTMYF